MLTNDIGTLCTNLVVTNFEAGKWTKTVSFWSRRRLWITVSWWVYILEVRERYLRHFVKIQNADLILYFG